MPLEPDDRIDHVLSRIVDKAGLPEVLRLLARETARAMGDRFWSARGLHFAAAIQDISEKMAQLHREVEAEEAEEIGVCEDCEGDGCIPMCDCWESDCLQCEEGETFECMRCDGTGKAI